MVQGTISAIAREQGVSLLDSSIAQLWHGTREQGWTDREMNDFVRSLRPPVKLILAERSTIPPLFSVSAFNPLALNEEKIEYFVQRGVNMFRHFGWTSWGMYDRESARERVYKLADANPSLLFMPTVLCDTLAHPVDYDRTVRAWGDAPANVLIELANEPYHASQRDDLLPWCNEFKWDRPHWAAGATRDDVSHDLTNGTFVTRHFERFDGDSLHRDDSAGWRWVRHAREGWDLSGSVNKYVHDNEPRRTDMNPIKHFAAGVLAKMFRMGTTFHYSGGLISSLPTDIERMCLEEKVRGFRLIPDEWRGLYYTPGSKECPFDSFAGAIRCYSVMTPDGKSGWVLALGTTTLLIEWREGVMTERLERKEHPFGGCAVYRVWR
jgi:hypothetical protein